MKVGQFLFEKSEPDAFVFKDLRINKNETKAVFLQNMTKINKYLKYDLFNLDLIL